LTRRFADAVRNTSPNCEREIVARQIGSKRIEAADALLTASAYGSRAY
jgi:hypothetical protein